ncbi:hypothetical protein J2752_001961 [Halarchaeum rubridurum]|uniref:Uncharacterized protein n=1 Tax=Halarchaeum rubridurum TaxID=489911 RepID=A0A830G0N9_9EURY|nr:hypothetical protein [Halarchaeum rubridurum]MBP1955049.1 hypothetical protein [Halarchaeum rubridurum]GGM69365.1 hypothetical protein GCM10009017_19440 [Halarchaeum rubridurum]
MGRMETGGTHSGTVVRADTRFKGDLGERVDAYLEENDINATELVREAVADYLPDPNDDEGPRIRPPSTPELETALGILQDLARNNDGTIPKSVAKQELAQKHSRDKGACDTTLIQPLRREGYINELSAGPMGGRSMLRIVLPSDIPRILDAADDDEHETVADEWDQLDAAEPAARADGGDEW